MSWKFHAVFGVAVVGCYLGVDYTIMNQQRPEGEKVSVATYLGGWLGFAAAGLRGGPAAAQGLAAALPEPPVGWARRPAAAGDAAALIAVPGTAPELAAVGGPREGTGLTIAAATYDRGAERVVIEAARLPNVVFTSFPLMATKLQAQMWVLGESAGLLGNVRGLDIHRTPPMPGLGARMAVASVGGQIHLRVVYPEAMDEKALLDLLQGLDVAAMNADVVEPEAAIAEAAKAEAVAAAAPTAPAEGGGGMLGFLAGAAGALGSMVGAGPKPVDLRDPDAVRAAIESGNVAGIQASAQAEFNSIAAALEASDSSTGTGTWDNPAGSHGSRPGKIKVGVGTCGERAGGGKFCSVRD